MPCTIDDPPPPPEWWGDTFAPRHFALRLKIVELLDGTAIATARMPRQNPWHSTSIDHVCTRAGYHEREIELAVHHLLEDGTILATSNHRGTFYALP